MPDKPTYEELEQKVRILEKDSERFKQAEAEISKAKNEWEMTFDAMSDIVTLMDKDMRIVRANKATHAFFKVDPGELNNRYCYELFRGASEPCP